MFRRRRLPGALQAAHESFLATLEPLERGKAALTESVPGARLPGRPLAETLVEFEDGLRQAAARMPGWRIPELEEAWLAAEAALVRCGAMSERLRLEADMPEGFEALIGTIGDLMAPLDAFGQAEERFRSLRR